MSPAGVGTARSVTAPVRPASPARPVPPRPRLTIVPPIRAGAPRVPFMILVCALLVAGLGGLLYLHTALAENSFYLHDLQVRSERLTDQEQALERRIARAAAPRRLAARARELGMVRSENPAFIRLSDGRILGKPRPGKTPPPPPAPSAHAEAGQPGAPGPAAPGAGTSPAGRPSAGEAAPTTSPSPATAGRGR